MLPAIAALCSFDGVGTADDILWCNLSVSFHVLDQGETVPL
jgi:hypothetical protein